MTRTSVPPVTLGAMRGTQSAHKLYLKMSYLELERTRRTQELAGLERRAEMIRDRIREIDNTVAETRQAIDAMPHTQAAPREIEETETSAPNGFSIRY